MKLKRSYRYGGSWKTNITRVSYHNANANIRDIWNAIYHSNYTSFRLIK